MAILITGGAGYIGSHTCIELLNAEKEIVVIDNLCNSKVESLKRVVNITGKDFPFYCNDVRDKKALRKIFDENKIEGVVHFAGLKAVGESVEKPLMYYENNLGATFSLLNVMKEKGVGRLVFSSSATVYGDPHRVPIAEDFPLSTTNPYGATKLMIENILQDIYRADGSWEISILRYFNPVGAHESGLIGEDPNGIPNNLVPYITQVAIGKLDKVKVFGDCYPTKDGTGIRDYIHVVDLARGHVAALDVLDNLNGLGKHGALMIHNLGTGVGYSVLDMIEAFCKATGREIPYVITEPRAGDVAVCYADPSKAQKELGWSAAYGLQDMCRDAWRWQCNNPDGYNDNLGRHEQG
ncbi:MAG: UDP-glucose 4-epimerase GalE [Anaerovoracaceae bacterium]|jgi:UDP-glucose 4-epimerase